MAELEPASPELELWSPDHVDDAQSKGGYHLVEYSHHANYHGINHRCGFDTTRHPEAPDYRHPPGRGSERRALGGPISPADAVQEFTNWIDEHQHGSRADEPPP